MPRSTYRLFTSDFPDKINYEIGNIVIVRIRSFHYEPKKFQIVSIQEVYEDGQKRYVYWGIYIGSTT